MTCASKYTVCLEKARVSASQEQAQRNECTIVRLAVCSQLLVGRKGFGASIMFAAVRFRAGRRVRSDYVVPKLVMLIESCLAVRLSALDLHPILAT